MGVTVNVMLGTGLFVGGGLAVAAAGLAALLREFSRGDGPYPDKPLGREDRGPRAVRRVIDLDARPSDAAVQVPLSR